MEDCVAVKNKLHAALKLNILGCRSRLCTWSKTCIHLKCVRTAGKRKVAVDVCTVAIVEVGGSSRVYVAHVDVASSQVAVGISHPEVFRDNAHSLALVTINHLWHWRHSGKRRPCARGCIKRVPCLGELAFLGPVLEVGVGDIIDSPLGVALKLDGINAVGMTLLLQGEGEQAAFLVIVLFYCNLVCVGLVGRHHVAHLIFVILSSSCELGAGIHGIHKLMS